MIPSGEVASAGERAGAGVRGTPLSIALLITMVILATAVGMEAIMIPIIMATHVATMEGITALATVDGTMAIMTAIMGATTQDTAMAMLLGLLHAPTTTTTITIPIRMAHAPQHVAQGATQPTPAYVMKAISAHLAPTTKRAARSLAPSTAIILAPTKAIAPHSSATTTIVRHAPMTKALPDRPTIPTRVVVVDTPLPLVAVSM